VENISVKFWGKLGHPEKNVENANFIIAKVAWPWAGGLEGEEESVDWPSITPTFN